MRRIRIIRESKEFKGNKSPVAPVEIKQLVKPKEVVNKPRSSGCGCGRKKDK